MPREKFKLTPFTQTSIYKNQMLYQIKKRESETFVKPRKLRLTKNNKDVDHMLGGDDIDGFDLSKAQGYLDRFMAECHEAALKEDFNDNKKKELTCEEMAILLDKIKEGKMQMSDKLSYDHDFERSVDSFGQFANELVLSSYRSVRVATIPKLGDYVP